MLQLICVTACCRLFRNIEEIEKLSELGVLFLLFEMGLELSFDRLKVGPRRAHIRRACSRRIHTASHALQRASHGNC